MAYVSISEWLQIARRKDVVQRSLKVGLLVGTILVAINYSDRVITADLSSLDYVKMAVTYLVPYCVCTYASVSALLKRR
ncbi:MAG: nitrate/nitrite transporter NrtS [Acidiferrobacterales bacterium]